VGRGDINAARDELLLRSIEGSEVFLDAGGGVAGGFRAGTDGSAPRPDLEARS
jgi:hypothetical protein